MSVANILPPAQNWTRHHGQDMRFSFTYAVASYVDGQLIWTAGEKDITGWAIEYTFFDPTGALAFSKTVGSGVTITDGTAGAYEVDVADTDTDAITGRCTYYVRRTDAGSEHVMAWGKGQLLADTPGV